MKIVIADDLAPSAVDLLRREDWTVDARTGRSRSRLAADLADADGLVVRSATKVDSTLIGAAPRLRVIAKAGTGVDNVDLQAASARGILVLNAPGANSVSVAEHACALMLALARSISRADAGMKQGRWEKARLVGAELRGKTLGVVGLGRIGQEVARLALAFGMLVLAHDPFITAQVAGDLGAELVSLDELCAQADFVTLHVPSTSTTRHMFDAARFARCKAGMQLINTARGDLIHEPALVEAIESGRIGGAGLDVFQVEPPADSRLASLPQVIATPHIAGSTEEAQELVGLETTGAVRDFLRHGIVRNAVNFPSIAPEDLRRIQPFVTLAERLGSFLGQISGGRTDAVGIRYYGDLATGSSELLVGATLVGLFKTVLSSTITPINARAIAAERGLEVTESRSTRPRDFTSLLSVKLHTTTGERWVEGTLFHQGSPRLVLLDGVELEAPLEGMLIVIRNNDQPGVIGEVGTILGRHGINIATFALGRGSAGAVAVVKVDQGALNSSGRHEHEIGEAVLAEIRAVPAVQEVGLVTL